MGKGMRGGDTGERDEGRELWGMGRGERTMGKGTRGENCGETSEGSGL